MPRLARQIRLAALTASLPMLVALALSAQLLLPLWHSLGLSESGREASQDAVCLIDGGEPIVQDCCPSESTPESRPSQPEHDPSTCPTCLQIFFAKTFGTPTLLAPVEMVIQGEWGLEPALEAQIYRHDLPLEQSARAPPSC
jgi:hypothetical protein